jgi:hypothetical protein
MARWCARTAETATRFSRGFLASGAPLDDTERVNSLRAEFPLNSADPNHDDVRGPMDKRTRSDAPSLTPANGPPSTAHGGDERGEITRHEPVRDPITPFAHGVLELFRGPLSDVRFPDTDRVSLEALAEACCEAQLEVEALEAALESARARTRGAQEALADHASRALAYARVFAIGQRELEEAIAAVRSPSQKTDTRDAKTTSSTGQVEGEVVRRRGRPRKVSGEPLLPMDEPSELASVGAAE